MTFTRASYIGPQGAFWERLCLVFEGLGYEPPKPDTLSEGAYLFNVAAQYQGTFTSEEIIQIAEHAQYHSVENLQHANAQGWTDRAAVFGERSL